jgi:hypothetical protein
VTERQACDRLQAGGVEVYLEAGRSLLERGRGGPSWRQELRNVWSNPASGGKTDGREACGYPGKYSQDPLSNLFVSFDHPLDELGLQGVSADIIAGEAPAANPEGIRAVGLVLQEGSKIRLLPDSWVKVLDVSSDKPWRVHLFVPKHAVGTVRQLLNRKWPWAQVFPLP